MLDEVPIDNLWFIGHFYHDRRRHVEPTCEIREGAIVIDYPLLKDIIEELPRLCPSTEYGCGRSV